MASVAITVLAFLPTSLDVLQSTWQILGLLSLLIALAGVGGMIYIGSQSKFIPYVVEVDKLGRTLAVALVDSYLKAVNLFLMRTVKPIKVRPISSMT